jgi:hypothetical protein
VMQYAARVGVMVLPEINVSPASCCERGCFITNWYALFRQLSRPYKSRCCESVGVVVVGERVWLFVCVCVDVCLVFCCCESVLIAQF